MKAKGEESGYAWEIRDANLDKVVGKKIHSFHTGTDIFPSFQVISFSFTGVYSGMALINSFLFPFDFFSPFLT